MHTMSWSYITGMQLVQKHYKMLINESLIPDFKIICGNFMRLHVKFHWCSYLNNLLLWLNMPANVNILKVFVEISYIKFLLSQRNSLQIHEEVFLFIVSTFYCSLMCLKIRINWNCLMSPTSNLNKSVQAFM